MMISTHSSTSEVCISAPAAHGVIHPAILAAASLTTMCDLTAQILRLDEVLCAAAGSKPVANGSDWDQSEEEGDSDEGSGVW